MQIEPICTIWYTDDMNSLRSKAEKLRDQGYSYNMITKALGVPISTMSYWFRDRPFIPNKEVIERIKYGPMKSGAARHNARVKEVQSLRERGISEVGKLSHRDLWMLGIGLYIGEGAKSIESVRIMNSDPRVISISIRWFKEVCGLTEENIVICMHLYPDSNVGDCMSYWQKITGLPASNFRKTQIDRRLNKRRAAEGKLPYGTVQLRIVTGGDPANGVILFRLIMGWIDGAMSQV